MVTFRPNYLEELGLDVEDVLLPKKNFAASDNNKHLFKHIHEEVTKDLRTLCEELHHQNRTSNSSLRKATVNIKFDAQEVTIHLGAPFRTIGFAMNKLRHALDAAAEEKGYQWPHRSMPVKQDNEPSDQKYG